MPKWFDDLVPDHLRNREQELQALAQRKQVRYWLFRLQSEAVDGIKAEAVPRGFKAHYKKQEWWDGWENFGVTWDVESNHPLKTKPRYESIHEEWDHHIESLVRDQTRGVRQRRRAAGNGSEGNV